MCQTRRRCPVNPIFCSMKHRSFCTVSIVSSMLRLSSTFQWEAFLLLLLRLRIIRLGSNSRSITDRRYWPTSVIFVGTDLHCLCRGGEREYGTIDSSRHRRPDGESFASFFVIDGHVDHSFARFRSGEKHSFGNLRQTRRRRRRNARWKFSRRQIIWTSQYRRATTTTGDQQHRWRFPLSRWDARQYRRVRCGYSSIDPGRSRSNRFLVETDRRCSRNWTSGCHGGRTFSCRTSSFTIGGFGSSSGIRISIGDSKHTGGRRTRPCRTGMVSFNWRRETTRFDRSWMGERRSSTGLYEMCSEVLSHASTTSLSSVRESLLHQLLFAKSQTRPRRQSRRSSVQRLCSHNQPWFVLLLLLRRAIDQSLLIIVLVDYLWTYMRNNQKPRSSVLRKKTGKTILFERRTRIDQGSRIGFVRHCEVSRGERSTGVSWEWMSAPTRKSCSVRGRIPWASSSGEEHQDVHDQGSSICHETAVACPRRSVYCCWRDEDHRALLGVDDRVVVLCRWSSDDIWALSSVSRSLRSLVRFESACLRSLSTVHDDQIRIESAVWCNAPKTIEPSNEKFSLSLINGALCLAMGIFL